MIAKYIVEQFTRALMMGEPLKLPKKMWLGLIGDGGEIALPRVPMSQSEWEWVDGGASNVKLVEFAQTETDLGGARRAVLFDDETEGAPIASFDFDVAVQLGRRTILSFQPGALRVRFV